MITKECGINWCDANNHQKIILAWNYCEWEKLAGSAE